MRTMLLFALLLAATPEGSGNPPMSFRRGHVHVPREQALLVQEHLRTIVSRGWAVVRPGDLHHGHLLLSPDSRSIEKFDSLEELSRHVVAILYHSDEQLYRWRLDDGALPVSERRPRSTIGYLDGTVVAAVTQIPDPSAALDYAWGGTIHTGDLSTARPADFDVRRNVPVRTPAGTCLVNLQVDIGLGHGQEPTILVGGDQLKVTMVCMDPAHN